MQSNLEELNFPNSKLSRSRSFSSSFLIRESDFENNALISVFFS